MKRKFTLFTPLFLLFSFVSLNLSAQNLVPNPSFETNTSCTAGIPGLVNWINPDTATPDYYHACSPSLFGQGFSVPNNAMGHQLARTGDAYVGMIAYEDAPIFGCPASILATGWREYIEVQLTSPLVAGVTYCAQYYVNLSNSSRYSTDAHGMYFSTSPVTNVQTATALNFTPQVTNTTGQLNDTLGWTKVSGTYTATGGEQYIIIGNFKNDQNTNVQCFNSNQFFAFAYYLIDDVFVGVDGTCPGACNVIADIDVSYTGCDVGNANLSASGTGGSSAFSYLWNTGATTASLSGVTPGMYTVTLTDSAGCAGMDTIMVTVPQGPTVNLGPDTLVCKGESITLSGTSNPSTGVTWVWGGGQGGTSITVTPGSTGYYHAMVSDSNGCVGEDSVLVEVGTTPSVFIDLSQDTLHCLNDPAFAMALGTPTGGTYAGPGVTNNTFDPATAGVGQHTLTYTACDSVGCCDTDTFTVTVDVCSGITGNQLSSHLRAYPNPSQGSFMIKGLPAGMQSKDIRVHNALGQAVPFTLTHQSATGSQLNISTPGMYFATFQWEGQRAVLKLAVQQ